MLFAHKDSVTNAFDAPARDGVEGRGAQSHAGPKAEARVMQRTAQFIADDQPFCEGTVVMGATRSDGEEFVLVASQNYLFVPDSALDHSTVL
jgi:hypothetical protein